MRLEHAWIGNNGKIVTLPRANPDVAAASIRAAFNAVNANFYFGGFSGSRFNWVGGW